MVITSDSNLEIKSIYGTRPGTDNGREIYNSKAHSWSQRWRSTWHGTCKLVLSTPSIRGRKNERNWNVRFRRIHRSYILFGPACIIRDKLSVANLCLPTETTYLLCKRKQRINKNEIWFEIGLDWLICQANADLVPGVVSFDEVGRTSGTPSADSE